MLMIPESRVFDQGTLALMLAHDPLTTSSAVVKSWFDKRTHVPHPTNVTSDISPCLKGRGFPFSRMGFPVSQDVAHKSWTWVSYTSSTGLDSPEPRGTRDSHFGRLPRLF